MIKNVEIKLDTNDSASHAVYRALREEAEKSRKLASAGVDPDRLASKAATLDGVAATIEAQLKGLKGEE